MSLSKKLICMRFGLTALTICISAASICILLWWNVQLSAMINAINAMKSISFQEVTVAVGTMFLRAGMAYVLGLCSSWTLETMAHDLRMGYATHFTQLPLEEIENLSAGEQVSKLQNEINDVSNFLRLNLFSIVDDLIKFVATLSWMLWLNPKLTLLANIPVIFLMLYTVFASKVIGKAATESQQANAQMTGYLSTLITVFPILRLFDAARLINNRYNLALSKWQAATIKEERRRAGLMSVSAAISCLPLLMLFLIGGTQIIQGNTDIGTLYVFINLSGNVSGVMMNMPGRIAGFRRFAANMQRLEPYVVMERRPNSSEHTHSGHGFFLR